LASAPRPGRAAHSTATNAKILNAIVSIIFRFIDFPLRYGFQYTLETMMPLRIWFSDFNYLIAGVRPLSRYLSHETFLHNRCSRSIRPSAN
jgi:hypothetical protein